MLDSVENKSTIRNPFPMLGKVFKYEFISTARIFLPIYGALILIAFVAGLVTFTPDLIEYMRSSFLQNDANISPAILEKNSFITFILLFALWLLGLTSTIITFIFLNSRFNKSMLGDESYLNHTLPVTLGEHLWGRFLSSFCWILIYMISIALAGFLLVVKLIPLFSEVLKAAGGLGYVLSVFELKNGFSLVQLGLVALVVSISYLVMAILFIFLLNAISHLAKKNRVLVVIASIIVLISIYSQSIRAIVSTYVNLEDFASFTLVFKFLWTQFGMNIVFAALYMTGTYLIIKNRLNLE